MGETVNVVLVHNQSGPYNRVKAALDGLGVATRRVRTCQEASYLLKNSKDTEVVFTATTLPDGTWFDVLQLAEVSDGYLPVIVMSRTADADLYLSVLDNGAFGLITPPFRTSELAHIVRSAVYQELVSKSLHAAALA